jgi:hypothetical protein
MTVLKSFIVYTRGEKERQRLEEHQEQKINLQNLTFTFLSIHAKKSQNFGKNFFSSFR